LFAESLTDAITGPTPLGIMKEGVAAGRTVQEIMADPTFPDYLETMIGNQTGSLGEMSAIALLLGGILCWFAKSSPGKFPVHTLVL
jgi:Na+-translocating ferredoxin:NAD+ oxidoreductase subunit D